MFIVSHVREYSASLHSRVYAVCAVCKPLSLFILCLDVILSSVCKQMLNTVNSSLIKCKAVYWEEGRRSCAIDSPSRQLGVEVHPITSPLLILFTVVTSVLRYVTSLITPVIRHVTSSGTSLTVTSRSQRVMSLPKVTRSQRVTG